MGGGLPESPAPMPHGFIGQDDAACGHKLFDALIAQAAANVEPGIMIDGLGYEPMALAGLVT